MSVEQATGVWQCDVDKEARVGHVYPLDDLIEHVKDAGCLCGPDIQMIPGRDGLLSVAVMHSSLDGRELAERARANG